MYIYVEIEVIIGMIMEWNVGNNNEYFLQCTNMNCEPRGYD